MSEKTPFWKSKTLDSMSHDEWESLCDGCARCCVHKLEDEETGDIYHTDVACRLLDAKTCRCTDYAHRTRRVADCLEIRPDNVHELTWLPATCAYRRLAEGKDLQWWHPLVSNDPKTVIEAGISVHSKIFQESEVDTGEMEEHIVFWLDDEGC